jgi:hypothetical protein
MNSIAMYCLAHLTDRFLSQSLRIHLGTGAWELLGPALAPMLQGGVVLLIWWAICWWMYRRKVFLRI